MGEAILDAAPQAWPPFVLVAGLLLVGTALPWLVMIVTWRRSSRSPAFTGSVSAYPWYRTARATGARPSLGQVSRLGLVLVPPTIGGALGALALVAPQAL